MASEVYSRRSAQVQHLSQASWFEAIDAELSRTGTVALTKSQAFSVSRHRPMSFHFCDLANTCHCIKEIAKVRTPELDRLLGPLLRLVDDKAVMDKCSSVTNPVLECVGKKGCKKVYDFFGAYVSIKDCRKELPCLDKLISEARRLAPKKKEQKEEEKTPEQQTSAFIANVSEKQQQKKKKLIVLSIDDDDDDAEKAEEEEEQKQKKQKKKPNAHIALTATTTTLADDDPETPPTPKPLPASDSDSEEEYDHGQVTSLASPIRATRDMSPPPTPGRPAAVVANVSSVAAEVAALDAMVERSLAQIQNTNYPTLRLHSMSGNFTVAYDYSATDPVGYTVSSLSEGTHAKLLRNAFSQCPEDLPMLRTILSRSTHSSSPTTIQALKAALLDLRLSEEDQCLRFEAFIAQGKGGYYRIRIEGDNAFLVFRHSDTQVSLQLSLSLIDEQLGVSPEARIHHYGTDGSTLGMTGLGIPAGLAIMHLVNCKNIRFSFNSAKGRLLGYLYSPEAKCGLVEACNVNSTMYTKTSFDWSKVLSASTFLDKPVLDNFLLLVRDRTNDPMEVDQGGAEEAEEEKEEGELETSAPLGDRLSGASGFQNLVAKAGVLSNATFFKDHRLAIMANDNFIVKLSDDGTTVSLQRRPKAHIEDFTLYCSRLGEALLVTDTGAVLLRYKPGAHGPNAPFEFVAYESTFADSSTIEKYRRIMLEKAKFPSNAILNEIAELRSTIYGTEQNTFTVAVSFPVLANQRKRTSSDAIATLDHHPASKKQRLAQSSGF